MSSRYVAMWGELQISPRPRQTRDRAEHDKRRWDRQHPDKPATIVEVKRD